jgi:hypothetical protein
MVMKKPNGQLHFIAGSSGSYGEIGKMQKCHHDQTFSNFGTWQIVNEISYETIDGEVIRTFKVPPVIGETMAVKASMAVFK